MIFIYIYMDFKFFKKAWKPKSSIWIHLTNPIWWYLYIYIFMDLKFFKKAWKSKSSIWIHLTNPIWWYLCSYGFQILENSISYISNIYLDLKSFYICLILIFSLRLIVLYKRSCQRNWRITTVGETTTPICTIYQGTKAVPPAFKPLYLFCFLTCLCFSNCSMRLIPLKKFGPVKAPCICYYP